MVDATLDTSFSDTEVPETEVTIEVKLDKPRKEEKETEDAVPEPESDAEVLCTTNCNPCFARISMTSDISIHVVLF